MTLLDPDPDRHLHRLVVVVKEVGFFRLGRRYDTVSRLLITTFVAGSSCVRICLNLLDSRVSPLR